MSGTLTAPRAAGSGWLPRLAWGALIYTVLVILWGAVVRIAGAGAGCGDHWPLCDGVVVPQSFDTHRIIEFSHRVTSMLNGLVVIALAVAAFRFTPRGHPARISTLVTIGLILLEGVVGGVQVLLKLTATSTDPARGFFQGIHLANTFALVGSMLVTLFFAYGYPPLRLRGQGLAGLWSYVGLVLVLILGMAGAVTALGDLLFVPPAGGTPIDTIKRDYATTATVIENLRLVHPMMAILASAFLVWLGTFLRRERPGANVERWSMSLWVVIGVQVAVGFLNVALKAPAWIQLVHLLLAIALWLTMLGLVYFALTSAPLSPAAARRGSAA